MDKQFKEQEIYDVAIIGAGAGGMTAANYASRAGLKVALIERGVYGGVLNDTSAIENYSGFTSITGSELAQDMESQSKAQESVEHLYGDVKELYKNEVDNLFHIALRKKVITAKTVVVATGVKHKKLGVTGESKYEGSGISYCAVCDGGFFKEKRVAVIGGGDSAIENALYLSNIADRVTVLHRRDELRAEKILQDKLFEKDNIEVLWNADTSEFRGDDRSLGALSYLDKEDGSKVSLGVDGVFVYVGVEPSLFPISHYKSVTDENGFIETGNDMSTAIDGLYAVGDIRSDSIRQIATATGDGAIASDSIVKYLRNITT